MRRLLALACSIVLVDTIFYAAISPLLPRFAEEFDLSKGEAGLLVATYALGAALGAIPSGLVATRVGVKATVVLGLLVVAATSVLFGFVSDYWLLDLTRLAQGIASAFCWTGALAWLVAATPQKRRGETIGIAASAAVVGSLLGPMLGAAAVHFGRPAAFSAIGVIAIGLALLTLRTPAPPPGERQPLRLMLVALRERSVLAGMWLLMVPALIFGTVSALGPLQLDGIGWGAIGIAATFAVAALVEASLNPLVGRWSDRRGRLAPLQFGLAASFAVLLAIPWIDQRIVLSAVLVCAAIASGTLWTPSTALLSDGWEAAGVGHALGFALMNFAWAGTFIGAAAGGALAQAGGDLVAYTVVAALCALTLAGVLALRREPLFSTARAAPGT
jgi:MFS family permease